MSDWKALDELFAEVLRHYERSRKQGKNFREIIGELSGNFREAVIENICKFFPEDVPGKSALSNKNIYTKRESETSGKARGTRLSPDWTPATLSIQFAKQNGLSDQDIAVESEKFRNYWTSKTGSAATKLDWLATWKNWVLRVCETRGIAPALGLPDVSADIPAKIFVEIDTPQWDAWRKIKKSPQTDYRIDGLIKRGWWFPSEWPPIGGRP